MKQQLFAHICGLTEEATWDEIEQALNDQFAISSEGLEEIVDKLLVLVDVAKSDLTTIMYKGFSKFVKNSNGKKVKIWLLKIEY